VPELSRRARGFATWALIRHLGRQGIAGMVDRHCRAAAIIAARLRAETAIEVMNDVELNQIVVRFGAGETPERGDRMTQDTIARIQSDGTCFAGGAKWRGRQVMRISVIAWLTDEAEADKAAEAMIDAWHRVRQGS
jgi:glutamate/tyrosine decarboxylase-like PLP-dependent enzyme